VDPTPAQREADRSPLGRLVRRLDLETADAAGAEAVGDLPGEAARAAPDEVTSGAPGADRFRVRPFAGEGWLFGGLVAALAVVAAGRTVEGRMLHSLHGYFLRPGRRRVPIEIEVERLRDGHVLAARRVELRQGRDTTFAMLASFAPVQRGLAHQETSMPDVPPPEGLPDWEDVRAAAYGTARRPDGPLEIRECEPEAAVPAAGQPARRRVWMRPRGVLPDDPLVHAAVLVFASDRNFLSTAARPHGLLLVERLAASLDHAIWLHQPPRFDDWVLYASESPVAQSGRALVQGAMYTRAGVRLASVAQEGIIRAPRGPGE